MSLMLSFILLPFPARAQEGHEAHEEVIAQANKPVEVGNKICPVSGEKVEQKEGMGKIVKIEHNGKLYNLCCSMCVKDFKKDPEKYVKIVEDQMKADVMPASDVKTPEPVKTN